LVGANTGKTETAPAVTYSVAVGANSLGLPTSSGMRNVFLGYNVAGVGIDSNAHDNVIVTSSYYGTKPTSSTIIGYQTYEGGYSEARNITAIGYNACSSFNNTTDNKGSAGITTCIGYNTASNTGMNGTTMNLGWESDEYDHIFLGGKPQGGFGGRSVLEIHNIMPTNSSSLLAKPTKVGPTVVMNSHLVVRGNVYLPESTTGQVVPISMYSTFWSEKADKKEQGRDHCGRGCLGFGRKKYRKND
jgi:hypothetical protein